MALRGPSPVAPTLRPVCLVPQKAGRSPALAARQGAREARNSRRSVRSTERSGAGQGALFAAARPLQCRRFQTPPASHARRHCKRWRATEPQAGAQSRPPETPLNGRHAPISGRERGRASADLPNKTRHLPNFGQPGSGHPRVTENVDGFDPARTPAPWGPSAVCEKRGAEG